MDGVFPAEVVKGLKTVSGTAGPPTQNDASTNPENNPLVTQVAVAGDSGSFALPYTLQTGPIRYGPMPAIGQTKITATAQSMQYPTSSYDLARTLLGSADCVSTQFLPQTAVFTTQENTVGVRFVIVKSADDDRLSRRINPPILRWQGS